MPDLEQDMACVESLIDGAPEALEAWGRVCARVRRCVKRHVTLEHVTAESMSVITLTVTEEDGRFVVEVENVPGAVGYAADRDTATIEALRAALAETLHRLEAR